MIGLEQAKGLRDGDVVFDVTNRNADGSPRRWRVSGVVRTWDAERHRVSVPLKQERRNHYDLLTESDLGCVCLSESAAMGMEA